MFSSIAKKFLNLLKDRVSFEMDFPMEVVEQRKKVVRAWTGVENALNALDSAESDYVDIAIKRYNLAIENYNMELRCYKLWLKEFGHSPTGGVHPHGNQSESV